LGFIKSSRAKQKIKQWLRHQSKEENIARGRTMLDKVLKRLGLVWPMEDVFALFTKHYKQMEEFLAALGTGDLTSNAVVSRLELHISQQAPEEEFLVVEEAPPPPSSETISDAVSIRGTGGLLTNIAKCCKPLPGEEIIGYVTRGRGVTVHRCDCQNVLQMTSEEDLERLIEVEWGEEKQTFPVQIQISAYDRSGLLHDVTGVIANKDINLAAVSTGKRDRYNILPVYATIEIPDLATLTRVLAKIEQIPNVIETKRIG
jgi:GTP pyrophosphokinase